MIIPLAAGAKAYESTPTWEEFIGLDWGVDPSTNDPQQALERYIEHLEQMHDLKQWPATMVRSLASKAKVQEAYSDSALDFWNGIVSKEIGWMRESGIEPGSLPNYHKHIDFLRSVGAATAELEKVKAEYSPLAVGGGVFKGTFGDVGKKIDSVINPKKSPWPWVAGGVVLLLLLKR